MRAEKSSISPATWLRNPAGSNSEMRLIFDLPARAACQNGSTPIPAAVTTPSPVRATGRSVIFVLQQRRDELLELPGKNKVFLRQIEALHILVHV